MSRAMEKMTTSSMQQSQGSERQTKIEELIITVANSQQKLSERMTDLEEKMTTLTNALNSSTPTSQPSPLDSLMSDVNEMKTTLNGQSETLSALGETVSDKRVVKLSDGSEVSASELQAHSMMKRITEQMTTLTSTSEKLAEEVHAKSRVLDDEKAKAWLKSVGSWIAKKVNEHFDQAVQEPVDGLKSDLEGFHTRG